MAIKKISKLKAAILFTILLLSASFASISMKLGANKFAFSLNPIEFIGQNYYLILGYLLYIVPFLISIYMYKFFKVAIVQGVVAGVYIIIPIIAFSIGLESFNIYKIIGIVIVFSAILLILTDKNQ